MKICAAIMALLCFCGSDVFAMFSEVGTTYKYNNILVEERGYPIFIEWVSPFVEKKWSEFWWVSRVFGVKGIDFKRHAEISRSYPFVAEISIKRGASSIHKTEKVARIEKAFKEAGDPIFYLFLEDYFKSVLKKRCLTWFSSECLWKVMYEINPVFVDKKLGEDWREYCEKISATETDIDECFLGSLSRPLYPCKQNTLNAVQFIAESLYYMNFDNLIVFFSTLYSYFFKKRVELTPEEIYIVYHGLVNLYYWMITVYKDEYFKKSPQWFESYQYHQLLDLQKCCNPDSEVFRSYLESIELKYLEIKK